MRSPFSHPSRLQQVTDFASSMLDHRSDGVRVASDRVGASLDTAAKAGWIAGGVLGLTAVSAGISSLRRRGAEDGS